MARSTFLNILISFFVRLISRLNPMHLAPCQVISRSYPCHSISNIMDLPEDLILVILQRVGAYDVLMNGKRVCKLWHALSQDSCMWRVVDIRRCLLIADVKKRMPCRRKHDHYHAVGAFLENIALSGVELSRGRLFHLCIQDIGSDLFLLSVSQRSSRLRHLIIIDRDPSLLKGCTIEGLINMFKNLPLLEELQLHFTPITGQGIELAGGSCPHLRSFALNSRTFSDHSYLQDRDEQAIAIAKSMPRISCLKVIGNAMTATGLISILEFCHSLEILDLRDCYNLYYALEEDPDLEVRLEQQIQQVRFPSEHYENDD